jgi:vacuolar-type H+-ATPase subunit E/Vma4
MGNGATELAAQILKEAEEAAEATRARASRAAERETEAARQDIAAAGERERGTEEVRKEAEKRRLVGTATMGRRRLVERRRHELVEAVFRDVEEHLPSIRGAERYPSALLKLCRHSLAELPEESIVLEVDAEDWERLPADFTETLKGDLGSQATVEVRRGRPGWGGGVVGRGSRVEVDNRLPRRLERLRKDLSAVIARSLFGD